MSRRKTHAEFLEEMAARPIEVIGEYTGAHTKIAVRCETCGNEWEATPSSLLQGSGCPDCFNRARALRMRKENVVLEDHVSWLLVDISTPEFPGATMAIDKVDFDRLAAHGRMRAYKARGNSYIYVKFSTPVKGSAMVHRSILKCPDGLDIDHKRHGSMTYIDNRRSNLRLATRSQNFQNKGKRADNTSGVTGVCFDNRKNRWVSRICVNGKRILLGYFLPGDLLNAVAARKSAELRYFKDFAYAANNGGSHGHAQVQA